MKKYMVYSFDLKVDYEDQETHVLAICDTAEEAVRLRNEFEKQTTEYVRVRSFDDVEDKFINGKKVALVSSVLLIASSLFAFTIGVYPRK